MKTIFTFVSGPAALLMLVLLNFSCSKQETNPQKGIGKLNLKIGISVSEIHDTKNLKAGAEDFIVTVCQSNGDSILGFRHASEMPESIELMEGAYLVKAFSPNTAEVAFENPVYEGNSGYFLIKAGQTTPVTIDCKLKNIMVTVAYSEQVKGAFDNYRTIVMNGPDSLVFDKNEIRAGYFPSGPLHIISKLFMPDQSFPSRILTGDIADPQIGKHYDIQVDALPVVGNGAIQLIVGDAMDLVNVTLVDPEAGLPSFGDLLITEIMCDPYSLSDAQGEWVELYNTTDRTINLKGLVLRKAASSLSKVPQINEDVNINPGAYIVLGKSDTAADNVAYVYGSSLSLTNGGDEIILSTYGTDGTDGRVICSVNYGMEGFPDSQSGKSLQLNPSVKDALAAMDGMNWCIASQVYNTGDHGTPGFLNTACE